MIVIILFSYLYREQLTNNNNLINNSDIIIVLFFSQISALKTSRFVCYKIFIFYVRE